MIKGSIVIPCYRRTDWLKKTLSSVLNQSKDLKIITVYQDESDDPSLREWCLERNVVYIFSNQPSTPRSRNLGLARASGEVVIFFDDDVELLDGCLEAHLANYIDPAVVAVGGRVITVRETGEDQVKESAHKIGWVNRFGQFIGDQNYNSFTRLETNTTPLGCNMSFRFDSLKAINGFDETYIGNAMREETDPVMRLIRQGGKVVFDPEAAVKHFLAKTGGSRAKSKDRWYLDFFFNSSYFYYKFIRWPARLVAFCFLLPFLSKYWFRYGHSTKTIVAPFWQFRAARKKAEQS